MLGKCLLSAYHYNVGINTILCACTTIAFSVILVRDYWKGKWAPLCRFIISSFILAVLGRMLWYQVKRGVAPESIAWSHNWEVDKGNNTDSTIFLPMSCFLDPDLNPLRQLSSEQKNRVGGRQDPVTVEFCLYWLVVACFAAGHAGHAFPLVRRFRGKNEGTKSRKSFNFWAIVYYCVSLSLCVSIYLGCWVHISLIRTFVSNSGWIEGGDTDGNPEQNVQGIGQLIPLVTIGWVVINVLDQVPEPEVPEKTLNRIL